MSSANYFVPVPALTCVDCGQPVTEWIGLEMGLNVVWQQGEPHPIAERGDLPYPAARDRLSWTLHEDFEMVGRCPDGHFSLAEGIVTERLWTASKVRSDDEGRARVRFLAAAPDQQDWDDFGYDQWTHHAYRVRFRTGDGAVYEYPITTRCGRDKAVAWATFVHLDAHSSLREFPLNVDYVDLGEGWRGDFLGDHHES